MVPGGKSDLLLVFLNTIFWTQPYISVRLSMTAFIPQLELSSIGRNWSTEPKSYNSPDSLCNVIVQYFLPPYPPLMWLSHVTCFGLACPCASAVAMKNAQTGFLGDEKHMERTQVVWVAATKASWDLLSAGHPQTSEQGQSRWQSCWTMSCNLCYLCRIIMAYKVDTALLGMYDS